MTNKQTGTSGLVERIERVLHHAEAYEAPADGIAYGEHILRFADIRALIASLSPVPVDEVTDAMIDAGLEAAQGYVRSKGHHAPDTDELTPDALVQMRSYVAAIVGAALTASRPYDDGWMPIETAPKDGRYILINAPSHDGGMTVACFDESWNDEGWWLQDDGKNPELPLRGKEPTHWRSLPDAPAALASLVGEK